MDEDFSRKFTFNPKLLQSQEGMNLQKTKDFKFPISSSHVVSFQIFNVNMSSSLHESIIPSKTATQPVDVSNRKSAWKMRARECQLRNHNDPLINIGAKKKRETIVDMDKHMFSQLTKKTMSKLKPDKSLN